MPTFKLSKQKHSQYSDQSLRNSVKAVKDGMSRRQASKTYGVPFTTICRYEKTASIASLHSLSKPSKVTKQVFTSEEEKALNEYIITSVKMFYGLSKEQTRKLAYEFAVMKCCIIPESWARNQMAGEDWLLGLRKRCGNLSLRHPEAMSMARAMGFNRHAVGSFFTNLKEIHNRNGAISPQSMFNLDETGLSTVNKPSQIIAEKGVKQIGRISSAELGVLVTMCGCISGIGNALPPAFIFPLVHFKDHMLSGAPLFLDNHISHLSIAAIDIARENGLAILTFPPHCSHRLQPLDVAVYGPFKRFFSSFADSWMTGNEGSVLSIYQVAQLAFTKSFTIENILSAFKSTGIYPLNVDIFADDAFLPSQVTYIPQQQNEESAPSMMTSQNENFNPNLHGVSDRTSHLDQSLSSEDSAALVSLRPFPRIVSTAKRSNRRKTKSSIITDTPEKQNIAIFRTPKRSTKLSTAQPSSSSEDDVMSIYRDAESGEEEFTCSDDDESVEVSIKHPIPISTFVVVKVRPTLAAMKHRNFIAQITDGPDDEEDYEVKFLKKSDKINQGYLFQEEEDLASVGKSDIIAILPLQC